MAYAIHAVVALILLYVGYEIAKYLRPRILARRKIHPGVDIPSVAPEYEWRTEKLPQYRPFKSQYREVMNIGKIAHEDWLIIDSEYDAITEYNKQVIQENPEITCQAADTKSTLAAARETYDFVITTLIQRYPQYFENNGRSVYNKIKGCELPRTGSESGLSAGKLLGLLSENVAEDFLLLEFDEQSQEYRLRALSGVSSGANLFWVNKLNLKMTDVHQPVPGYKEHLQFSMNKFFKKMVVGQWVQRITWLLQVTPPHEEGTPVPVFEPNRVLADDEKPNFNNEVFVRVTRQILSRLPKTKFLVFTQRAYLYPLSQIKTEGYGQVLADNIETMPEATGAYRGRTTWGTPVLRYLRS